MEVIMEDVIEELEVTLSNPVYKGKDYVITDADYNSIAEVTKGKIDLTIYAKKTDLTSKVDKVTGKSLIADTEIVRLGTLHNYDDTQVRALITTLTSVVNGKADKSELFSGNYNDLTNKPTIPSKTSDLTNDSAFIDNTYHDTSKVDKVTGKGLSTNDYTTTEKQKLSGIEEQANKTIVDSALSDTSTNPVQNKVVNSKVTELNSALANKQATLVSGTNIKTINNQSLLGSGNIAIEGGGDVSYLTIVNGCLCIKYEGGN